ncbi:hypothetical protein L208DRAFT_1390890 [Tricholoma matsutake]|nr:hypothetical protein L208DRAFT_1390890 [Tricholoma matsutake 945]
MIPTRIKQASSTSQWCLLSEVSLIIDVHLRHLSPIQRQPLTRRLANDGHTTSIRLAGRIYRADSCVGDLPHKPLKPKKTSTLPSFLSHIASSSSSHVMVSHQLLQCSPVSAR